MTITVYVLQGRTESCCLRQNISFQYIRNSCYYFEVRLTESTQNIIHKTFVTVDKAAAGNSYDII